MVGKPRGRNYRPVKGSLTSLIGWNRIGIYNPTLNMETLGTLPYRFAEFKDPASSTVGVRVPHALSAQMGLCEVPSHTTRGTPSM